MTPQGGGNRSFVFETSSYSILCTSFLAAFVLYVSFPHNKHDCKYNSPQWL